MNASFDYAILRVVPRVERQEFINVGVVFFCRERRFLKANVLFDEARVLALWPEVNIELLNQHLSGLVRICDGDSAAGPMAQLTQSERFLWLTSPRSTMLQTSPVHTGICLPEMPLSEMVDRILNLMAG